MISDGIILMFAGMGTVFLFLSLMVVVMQGASALLGRYTHLIPEEAPQSKRAPQAMAAAAGYESQRIAVILAAVKAYRDRS